MLKVRERLEEFYNKEIYNYDEHWSDRACDIIADVYAIGLNTEWCVARLNACDYVGIFKGIINKCRDLVDFWALEEQDKKMAAEILKNTKKRLYGELQADIYNYCIL